MPRLHITLNDFQNDQMRALSELLDRPTATLISQSISEFIDRQTDGTKDAIYLTLKNETERLAKRRVVKWNQEKLSKVDESH